MLCGPRAHSLGKVVKSSARRPQVSMVQIAGQAKLFGQLRAHNSAKLNAHKVYRAESNRGIQSLGVAEAALGEYRRAVE